MLTTASTAMDEDETGCSALAETLPRPDTIECLEELRGCNTSPIAQPILFSNKTLLELSKAEWVKRQSAQNPEVQPYTRGCAWSPDGTCCLVVVNGGGVHMAELPRDLYDGTPSCHRPVNLLNSVLHVRESGLIYDYCWYPAMNSALPETCCWLTSRQHGPVQMWDAFDGGLRCSYRGFDAVDEMEPALSVAFSPDGASVYAGYKKCLRTFHTCRPGRDCSTHALKAPAASLASAGRLLAVGSWNTSLSLFSVSEMGTLKSVGKMHGHSGGVTHVRFTPDGTKLVSGARKDPRLLVFDLRHLRRPLRVLHRRADTNQRVTFDLSACGRYLVSAGTDGALRVWDAAAADWGSALSGDLDDNPTYTFPLHNDCLNSVSIHPHRPIIATGSGQYHSRDPIGALRDSSEDIPCGSSSDRDGTVQSNIICESDEKDLAERCNALTEVDSMDVVDSGEVKTENSLVFWWVGSVPDL